MTSIHPRVVNGKRCFDKVNTCGKGSKAIRLEQQRAGIEKHLVDHPRDGLSRARVARIQSSLGS